MSSQYLQSLTPNEELTIRVNDATIRGNLVVNGTANIPSIQSTGTIAANSLSLNNGSSFTQSTSPTTTVNATSAKDTFQITTFNQTLLAGGDTSFLVSLEEISLYDNAIISNASYSGTYGTNGLPFAFIQFITTSSNQLRIGVINLAPSAALNGVLTLQISMIRGIPAS